MAEPTVATFGAPLKPQKKLAAGLLALFIAWLAVLWVMYFTTVFRHEHVVRVGPDEPSNNPPTMTVPRQ